MIDRNLGRERNYKICLVGGITQARAGPITLLERYVDANIATAEFFSN
jgi:hypothetical protein